MAALTGSVAEAEKVQSPVKGILWIGLGAFCFSLAPVFARSVVEYSTAAIAFYRALTAAFLLAMLTASSPSRRQELAVRKWGRSNVLAVLALGVLMGLTSLLYTHAYLHTTVAKAVLLNYTAPIYIVFLGPWLLREIRSRFAWPAVILGFGGIALIAEPAKLASFSAGEIQGIIAGAASGLTFAFVFLLGRYLAGKVEPIARTLVGALVICTMFVYWGVTAPADVFWRNLPWLAGLGIVGWALPYLFIFRGQKSVTAQVGSMAALFEPVCGVIVGYVAYGESLSLLGMIGAAAVLVSIYLSSK